MSVGIDAISLYIPNTYLDISGEWSQRRASTLGSGDAQSLVQKISKGIGIDRLAWPDAHEDTATMGAMAFLDLLKNHHINPKEVGQVYLASETGVDHSKPLSTYILGMIEEYYGEDLSHIGTVEMKFACIGSTYALEAALSMVESNRMRGKYVVVICTDHARYDLESQAEYTQGAGAMAMAISRQPRLLALDPVPMGTYVKNERDFYRPLWEKTPVVDGKYSMSVYEKAVLGAFEDYKSNMVSSLSVGEFFKSFDFHLYHIPFPSMAKHTVARFFEEYFFQNLDGVSAQDFRKVVTSSTEFLDFFNQRVAPGLKLSRAIGNIYTGALYLGLCSLLKEMLEQGQEMAEKSVLFNAYGSGASSKVFSGKFQVGWREVVRDMLKSRYFTHSHSAISYDHYLATHRDDHYLKFNNANLPSFRRPENEFCLTGLGESKVNGQVNYGLRLYRFAR